MSRSFGKVSCDLTVPLGGGEEQAADRHALAEWLRKITGSTFTAIADAVESAPGEAAVVHVEMSAEDADLARRAVLRLTDQAANPLRHLGRDEMLSSRAAAYGLNLFYRAWVTCTGWDGRKQLADCGGNAALGSGYSR